MKKPKLLCIVGPTSSGKTSAALAFAKQYNGEIINADARQIYQKTSIGTGKPPGEWDENNEIKAYFVQGIAHHLMDTLAPEESSSVVHWHEQAEEIVEAIVARGHLPILAGGTGLYIQALVEGYAPPMVPPQREWREKMGQKTLSELVARLQERDPASAAIIDLKNPYRVLRALEVSEYTGRSFVEQRKKHVSPYNILQVGFLHSREQLYQKIEQTIDEMLARGWVEEVRSLRVQGVPITAPAMTSLGYREINTFLDGTHTLSETRAAIIHTTQQYAKRQQTWFKRDKSIHWFSTKQEMDECVGAWLASE